jgi:hypothetical protein
LLPLTDAAKGTCVARSEIANIAPSGAGQTFGSRHTYFIGDWAITKWYAHENSGGEMLWHRSGDRWCVAVDPSVYLDQQAMVKVGVPAATARQFRYDLADYMKVMMHARRHEPSALGGDGD